MKKVTLWYKFDGLSGRFRYNHCDYDGWDIGTPYPKPESEEQKKSWNNARWAKEFAYMDGQKVKHLSEV